MAEKQLFTLREERKDVKHFNTWNSLIHASCLYIAYDSCE